MEIEKLIAGLSKEAYGSDVEELLLKAATALSALQAEIKRLNKIVCSIPTTPDSGRTVSQYDKEMSICAYLDDLEAENEKLRAELEQVKRERDAAVASWRGFCAKCAWNGKQYLADGKMDDRCKTCRENGKCNWQWRGQKEDGNG